MNILSCGSGMQSSALALMSCENVKKGMVHPSIPIYDAIIFVDLGCEPEWVYRQTTFVSEICKMCNIPFYILKNDLYTDHMERIRNGKFVKMPLWTMNDGKRGKLRRGCTFDYKIKTIQQFVKYELLGYDRKKNRTRPEDSKAHTMHIGFSAEEKHRASESLHPMFINKFPLIELGLERKDNYKYILEEWGLKTKASSCFICPYHKNYYFNYLKIHYPNEYKQLCDFDRVLAEKPSFPVKADLYVSYLCKRICELKAEDCDDAETFEYEGQKIWNGF